MSKLFWMYNESFLKKIDKVIIFGAGTGLIPAFAYLKEKGVEIQCICDNDPEKVGQSYQGIPVVSPDAIQCYHSEMPVVIASNFFKEIFDQVSNHYQFNTIIWGLDYLPEGMRPILEGKRYSVKNHFHEMTKKQWMSVLPVFDGSSDITIKPSGKTALFFHAIPKTGGRSFQEIAKKSCSDKVSIIGLESSGSIDLSGNPIPNGNDLILLNDKLFQILSNKGLFPRMFTILRDPVDRLVSEFYFRSNNKNDYPEYYIEVKDRLSEFECFVKKMDHLNYYCRIFSGNIPQKHIRNYACVPDTYEGSDTSADYTAAINNLDQFFFFIGLFEAYEKTLFSFFDLMSWNEIQHVPCHYNKTTIRPHISDFKKDIQQMLREKTYYDQKLYNLYKDKFSATYNNDYGIALKHFQNNNVSEQ